MYFTRGTVLQLSQFLRGYFFSSTLPLGLASKYSYYVYSPSSSTHAIRVYSIPKSEWAVR